MESTGCVETNAVTGTLVTVTLCVSEGAPTIEHASDKSINALKFEKPSHLVLEATLVVPHGGESNLDLLACYALPAVSAIRSAMQDTLNTGRFWKGIFDTPR